MPSRDDPPAPSPFTRRHPPDVSDDSATCLGFDSASLPTARRFDAYHALYARGADAQATGPGFSVTMRGWRLDRALLYDRHLVDVAHARDAARAGHDGLDHLTLTLVMRGDYHVDTGPGFRRVAPGEILIIDMRQPMRNRAVDAHVLTLSLAREALVAAVGNADGWHGHVVAPDRAALLADHLASLARHGALLSPASLMAIGRVTIELLGIALAASPAHESLVAARPHIERRDRVRAFIAERLADPILGPDVLVDRFALSRATLYRDFAPWGGLARYIRDRRLDWLRERLSAGDRRPIAEIAEQVGLAHEGRTSDSFHSRFGLRPGAYRRLVDRETALDVTHRRMGEWQSELR